MAKAMEDYAIEHCCDYMKAKNLLRDKGWEDDKGYEQSRPTPLQQIPATTTMSATRMPTTRMPAPRLPAALAPDSADIETSAGNLYYNVRILPGHIRLLKLLPHENEDAAIHCRLFCTALDSKGTQNLHAALLHLRDHSIERTIWIDAICINQDDKEEKGYQVQSIAKIYAKANRVIVWLGKEVAGSDQALKEIHIAAELSTLKEIRITAKLSARQLDNKAGILILLQRPLMQVLQEVAAARYTLIKCGSAEIDGFIFCSSLNVLNLSSELPADLRARILLLDNFSLDIRPLGELIEMYYTREATDRCDKKQLFNKLIHFFLSELVSVVGLSDDKENAVIESKGCILGEVSSVKRNATWEDRQDVAITWRNAPSYICVKEAWVSCWTLPTTVKSVQKGDVVCLLQGATRPTILRPYNDHWAVIMIAVSPAGDSQATTGDIKWSELLQSITVFPHNFLLIWDWDINLDRQQDKNNHDYFASIPEHSKTGLEGCLNAATRIRNVRLVLQEMKQYGVAVKNLREETAVLERALKSMSNLRKTCLDPEDSEKEDAKETMVNQLIEDKGQWTLLCLAAENGHKTVVKLLLDTGKVNLHREELRTARWFAEQKGYKAIVKMLLDIGKVNVVLRMRMDGQRGIMRQRMGMRR
ncbi:heterokaryon incompatibility protein-domain-containing protein [Pseudoneurospora amorphoporcata]|uniref:Heterokaryon incompatibility protein-domain-containing protein n=1 Tax=Pseudoneurospora amorphoporcata TaxID=241081 RepID=A0AAN6SBZ9_9PEZI|nr:heterokaryon incompatibility protein-domain-containing protein [Pseudoneurospora amorphoporcata]